MSQESGEYQVPEELFSGGRTFQIQVFDSEEADFRDLYERYDCIDLAIALSAATFLGSDVLMFAQDMWLTVDDRAEWAGIIAWLDQHVDSYEIRFFPYANGQKDSNYPVFWRRKAPSAPPQFLLCPHMNASRVSDCKVAQ